MVYKKCLVLTLIMFSINIQALTLRDGSEVTYAAYQAIWPALKALEKQDSSKLSYVRVACDQYSNNLANIPVRDSENQALAFYKDEAEKNETIAHCNSLNICEQDGQINENNAHIIRLAIRCVYKAPLMPVLIRLSSPIAWGNYFSWRYWLSKSL